MSLVFDRLWQANLKLKSSKCHFAQTSETFLGFVVSSEGILPDPDKILAVKLFPVPKSVKDVHSSLGLCNYYRRFVEGFAKITSPLNRLTRKDVAFVWSPKCETAFNSLKNRLCSPPILAYTDFERPFHLYTDASQSALGYILSQTIEGREHVISYGGRELNLAEKQYSTTEHEALPVVDGIKHYRPYLSGAKFYVHTNHGSLSWLMNVKDPIGRLARWALQLQQYDFDILYHPGSSNGNFDALSRRAYPSASMEPLPVLSVCTTTNAPVSLPVTPIDACVPSIQCLLSQHKTGVLSSEKGGHVVYRSFVDPITWPVVHFGTRTRSLVFTCSSFLV